MMLLIQRRFNMDTVIADIMHNNVKKMNDADLKTLRNWVNEEYHKRFCGLKVEE